MFPKYVISICLILVTQTSALDLCTAREEHPTFEYAYVDVDENTERYESKTKLHLNVLYTLIFLLIHYSFYS